MWKPFRIHLQWVNEWLCCVNISHGRRWRRRCWWWWQQQLSCSLHTLYFYLRKFTWLKRGTFSSSVVVVVVAAKKFYTNHSSTPSIGGGLLLHFGRFFTIFLFTYFFSPSSAVPMFATFCKIRYDTFVHCIWSIQITQSARKFEHFLSARAK